MEYPLWEFDARHLKLSSFGAICLKPEANAKWTWFLLSCRLSFCSFRVLSKNLLYETASSYSYLHLKQKNSRFFNANESSMQVKQCHSQYKYLMGMLQKKTSVVADWILIFWSFFQITGLGFNVHLTWFLNPESAFLKYCSLTKFYPGSLCSKIF